MNQRISDSELGTTAIPSRSRAYCKKYLGWVRQTSVEPTMWLYMMAYMTTSVVEQAFFNYKACRVDHGFSEEYCRNISSDEDRKKEIQRVKCYLTARLSKDQVAVIRIILILRKLFLALRNKIEAFLTVSNFHQWNNIAGHAIPIILALWFGNWSDRRGRKLPLLIGLCGKVVYSGMVVVNSLMPDWGVYMIIYTASLPMGFFGGDVAIFACCFSYISDVSSVSQRTFRVTILDVIYLSTMPTGIALGSYLFNEVFNFSYTIMFAINTSLLLLAIIYTFFALKWQTSPRQTPLAGVNALKDFFDKEHVKATIRTLTKSRPDWKQLHLWILFLAMALYTFQRDEKPMSYLYTQRMFNWDVKAFSKFRTFQSTLFVLAMLIGGPLMSKVLGMRDTFIVMIGALSHAIGRIFFATGTSGMYFYIGAGVAALGPIVAPVLRSLTSKVVPTHERGKVFAMLSVCDNAIPLFSGVLYTQLYNETYYSVPGAIYWLTFTTQIEVLLLILVIQISTRTDRQQAGDNSDTPETSNSECSPRNPLSLQNDDSRENFNA